MEIFSEFNRLYRESTAFPTIPPPTIQEKIFQSQKDDKLKKPNFKSLKNIFCFIKTQQTPIIFQVPEQITANPFVSQFNIQMYKENLSKLEQLYPKYSQINQDLKDPPFFENLIPDILINLEQQYQIDITCQRGVNPYLFNKDYSKNSVNVVGIFKNVSSCENIAQTIVIQNLPTEVIMHPVFQLNEFEEEATFQKYSTIELFKIDKSQTIKSQDQSSIVKYIKKMKKHIEDCQIYYAEIKDNKEFLISLFLSISLLQEGGTLIINVRDLTDPISNQYLYILSKLFSTFVLNTPGNNQMLFEISIYIGCYGNKLFFFFNLSGFNKKNSENVKKEILSNWDFLMKDNYFIINSFQMYQDQGFEKEIVQFLKDLYHFRSNQILLWKYIDEKTELVPFQVINQINILQAEENERQIHQKSHSSQRGQNRDFQRNTYQSQRNSLSQRTVMNVVSQTQISQVYHDFSEKIKTNTRVGTKIKKKQLTLEEQEELKRKQEELKRKEEEDFLLKICQPKEKKKNQKKKK